MGVIYIMSGKAYWQYINQFNMTHEELIAYLNRSRNFVGTITELHIKK